MRISHILVAVVESNCGLRYQRLRCPGYRLVICRSRYYCSDPVGKVVTPTVRTVSKYAAASYPSDFFCCVPVLKQDAVGLLRKLCFIIQEKLYQRQNLVAQYTPDFGHVAYRLEVIKLTPTGAPCGVTISVLKEADHSPLIDVILSICMLRVLTCPDRFDRLQGHVEDDRGAENRSYPRLRYYNVHIMA